MPHGTLSASQASHDVLGGSSTWLGSRQTCPLFMVTLLRRDLISPTGNTELSKNDSTVPTFGGRVLEAFIFFNTDRSHIPMAKVLMLRYSRLCPEGAATCQPRATSGVPREIALEQGPERA